jgi:hypothetical protein
MSSSLYQLFTACQGGLPDNFYILTLFKLSREAYLVRIALGWVCLIIFNIAISFLGYVASVLLMHTVAAQSLASVLGPFCSVRLSGQSLALTADRHDTPCYGPTRNLMDLAAPIRT